MLSSICNELVVLIGGVKVFGKGGFFLDVDLVFVSVGRGCVGKMHDAMAIGIHIYISIKFFAKKARKK